MSPVDTATIVFFAQVAIKLGPELYKQLSALIGPSIPTWDELAAENADLQALINAAKED